MIVEQGAWQEIKTKIASIAKFSSRSQARQNTGLSANFDKLTAQLRVKDETQEDLARQTGDAFLYGNCIPLSYEHSSSEFRLLFRFYRFGKRVISYRQHCGVFLLHHYPPVLASTMDRGRR